MDFISECIACRNQGANFFRFPCNHSLCCHCLIQKIMEIFLIEQRQSQTIEFKCCAQLVQLSLTQVRDILTQIIPKKSDTDAIDPPRSKSCLLHHLVLDIYCMDCQIEACSSCAVKGSAHFGHNYHTCNTLIEQLKQVPSISRLNFKNFEAKFEEEFNQIFIPPLHQFDKLIQTIERTRLEYIYQMKTEFNRITILLQIIRLLYTQFFVEIKNPLNDIKDLLFLNQVKFLTPNIQFNITDFHADQFENENNFKAVATISFKEIQCENFVMAHSLSGHSNWIGTLIELEDGRMASGSDDRTIKIWEIRENSYNYCTDTLTQHTEGVRALLQLKDGRMASGSWDKTIKIWGIKQDGRFICTHTLTGHTKGVESLLNLKDGKLVSGSYDNTIRIWESRPNVFICIMTITGHTKPVEALLQLKDGRVASGSYDNTIKIWDIKQSFFNCVDTLTGHVDGITGLLQLNDGRLASGSLDKIIRIWESRQNNFQCTLLLTGHTNLVIALVQLLDGKLASGSTDKTIRVWEIGQNSAYCTHTLTGHSDGVRALLQLKDGRLASGSMDQTIRLWSKIMKTKSNNQKCTIY